MYGYFSKNSHFSLQRNIQKTQLVVVHNKLTGKLYSSSIIKSTIHNSLRQLKTAVQLSHKKVKYLDRDLIGLCQFP